MQPYAPNWLREVNVESRSSTGTEQPTSSARIIAASPGATSQKLTPI
jgi:hypothetical protein